MRRETRAKRQLFDKDVLRTGQWMVAGRAWDVTLQLLRRLVQNFQLAQQMGVRVPVVWNHSNDARDKIGEVVRLYLTGETLRARFWAAVPEDIRRLNLTSDEASVEVAEPWTDGAGRRYDLFLTHVAIVNHPVVTDQGPIYRLQLEYPRRSENPGDEPMNESGANSTAADAAQDEEMLDVDAIVAIINEMVDALGTSYRLPDGTDSSNLLERLRALRDQIDAVVSEDTSPDTATAEEDIKVSASLQQQLDHVTRQLANERRQMGQEREHAFAGAVDRLIGEGRLTPADKESLLEAARPAGYSLSLLSPFERMPAGAVVPTSPASRRSANAKAPRVGRNHALSEDRVREIVRSYVA